MPHDNFIFEFGQIELTILTHIKHFSHNKHFSLRVSILLIILISIFLLVSKAHILQKTFGKLNCSLLAMVSHFPISFNFIIISLLHKLVDQYERRWHGQPHPNTMFSRDSTAGCFLCSH